MANTAKIYEDGVDYILETNEGNFIINNTGVFPTTRTGNNLTEVAFDITIQSTLDNAIEEMSDFASLDTAKGIRMLVTEKMEDFD